MRERQRLGTHIGQILLLARKRGAVGDALFAFLSRVRPLLLDGCHATIEIRIEPVDALEGSFRAAAPLLQAGQLGSHLRGLLLQALAALAQGRELSLQFVESCFSLGMFRFKPLRLVAVQLDRCSLGFARILVPSGLGQPFLQAPLNALRFAFHLAQSRALVRGVRLCLTALLAARFKLRGQFFNRARQRSGFGLRLSNVGFELGELGFRLAQFALEGQRAFRRRFAPGDRRVVEALPFRREEVGVRVPRGQAARFAGILHQVAVAELGQNRFKRTAKAIEHANRILERSQSGQRNDPGAADCVASLCRLIGLRVSGMNQERGPPIHAGLEQPNPFFCRAPAFDNNVVQLLAQKLVDHRLMRAVDLKKISQRTNGREMSA